MTFVQEESEEVVVVPPRRPLVTRVSRPRISTSQRKRGSLERGATPELQAQARNTARVQRKRRSHDKDIVSCNFYLPFCELLTCILIY